jgi:hypothetical protein
MTPAVTAISSTFTKYLLLNLRCASLKARIAVNEIQFAQVALRGGLIDPTAALAHLHEVGALGLVIPSSVPSP